MAPSSEKCKPEAQKNLQDSTHKETIQKDAKLRTILDIWVAKKSRDILKLCVFLIPALKSPFLELFVLCWELVVCSCVAIVSGSCSSPEQQRITKAWSSGCDLHDQSMGVREVIPESKSVHPKKRSIESRALHCHTNYRLSSNFSASQSCKRFSGVYQVHRSRRRGGRMGFLFFGLGAAPIIGSWLLVAGTVNHLII